MGTRTMLGLVLTLGVVTGVATGAPWAEAQTSEPAVVDQTPPRLSFTDGPVSFWRPGAQDWAPAQVNTPLAPGDELSTGSPGTLEIQIGARAFVRTWADTQLGLATLEPDFLQFRVTAGHAIFDLRTLEPGQTVEVDTPHGAFTIEHTGHYRVDVTGARTTFITRRAGSATVTLASGEAVAITPSEEVVLEGGPASAPIAAYVAPPLDDWDRWNYARTDRLLDALSARYVAPGTYGLGELDAYGTWRVVPSYGTVWVPTAVPTGWVPYSTGSWLLDPLYGWTWVDAAPWGWAPSHYGRWCFVDGVWAWAPGPVVARPVYAPALVAFLGEPSVGVGVPLVGWVALGWGEPVVPWWGREGGRHEPSWRGWGGPRIVNNAVITTTTVVSVQTITSYRNTSVPNAVVAVTQNHFGRGPITTARVAPVEVPRLRPTPTAPQIAASPASFVPTTNRGIRPPAESVARAVVATRPPHAGPTTTPGGPQTLGPVGVPMPAPRVVAVPPAHDPELVTPRPPFGLSGVERPMTDRTRGPLPPRPGPSAPSPPAGRLTTPPAGGHAGSPLVGGPGPAAPAPLTGRVAPRPAGGPGPVAPAPPSARVTTPPPGGHAGPPPVGEPGAAVPVLPTGRVAAPPVGAPTTPALPGARVTTPPPVGGPVVSAPAGGPGPVASTPPSGRVTTPPGGSHAIVAPGAGPAPVTSRTAVAAGQGPPKGPLPGEPANRLAPHRVPSGPPSPEKAGGS